MSSDGHWLATAADDGRIYIWNLNNGMQMLSPFKGTSQAMAVKFSPDGNQVAGGTVTGQVSVWRLPRIVDSVPTWLPDFAEAVGQFRLNDMGSCETIPFETLDATRRRVSALDGTDTASRWARWIASDPENRKEHP